jgi:putative addiction module antidote
MIEARIRKQGNSFVVTIPREELERNDLHEGDDVAVALSKIEVVKRYKLSPERQKLADEILEDYKDVFAYLAKR